MKLDPTRGFLGVLSLAFGVAAVATLVAKSGKKVEVTAFDGEDQPEIGKSALGAVSRPSPMPSPPEAAMALRIEKKSPGRIPWYREMPWAFMIALYVLSVILILISHKLLHLHVPLSRIAFSGLNSVRLSVGSATIARFVALDPQNYQIEGGEVRSDFYERLRRSIERMAKKGKGSTLTVPSFFGVVPDMSPYEFGQSAQHMESLLVLQRIHAEHGIPISVACGRRILGKPQEIWGMPGINLEGVSTFASENGQDYPLLFSSANGYIRSMGLAAAEAMGAGSSDVYARQDELAKMTLGPNSRILRGAYVPEEDYALAADRVLVIRPEVRNDGFLLSEDEEAMLVGKGVFVGKARVESLQVRSRLKNQGNLRNNEAQQMPDFVYEHITAAAVVLEGLHRFPEDWLLQFELAASAVVIFVASFLRMKWRERHEKLRWAALTYAAFALAVIGGTLIAACFGYLFDPSLGFVIGMGIDAVFAHAFAEALYGHGGHE